MQTIGSSSTTRTRFMSAPTGKYIGFRSPMETVHVRHEDVDDHQVERGNIERRKTIEAIAGDRNPEAAPLKPGADRKAGMQAVIDDQNRTHDGLPRRVRRTPRR